MITPRITAVNPWEVLRYLGAGQGETPAELLETVRRCGAELQAAARPKAVWRFFDLKGTLWRARIWPSPDRTFSGI